MSDSVPRQCLHIRKDDPLILKPPNPLLAGLSAEQTAIVPFKGQDIPSTWIPYKNEQTGKVIVISYELPHCSLVSSPVCHIRLRQE